MNSILLRTITMQAVVFLTAEQLTMVLDKAVIDGYTEGESILLKRKLQSTGLKVTLYSVKDEL